MLSDAGHSPEGLAANPVTLVRISVTLAQIPLQYMLYFAGVMSYW
jgi:hypothetical protein